MNARISLMFMRGVEPRHSVHRKRIYGYCAWMITCVFKEGASLLLLVPETRARAVQVIYKATGNLRAVQILLGHTKIENTVRYLGVDVEDALTLAEGIEI